MPPRAERYALMYRGDIHPIPAGSRVELALDGSLRIVTDVDETEH